MQEYELNLAVLGLKQGDLSMIEPIIEHHLKLIDRIASLRAKAFPYKYKDIQSASRLGAVKTCHWVAEGRMYNNKITPYMIFNCHAAITEFINEDHMVQIPRKTFKARVMRNEDNIFRYYTFSTTQKDFEEFIDLVDEIEGGTELTSKNETSEQYYDLFRELELNETEWKTVELRIMGYSLEEIAQVQNRSIVAVHKTIKRLRKRAAIKFSLRRLLEPGDYHGQDQDRVDGDGTGVEHTPDTSDNGSESDTSESSTVSESLHTTVCGHEDGGSVGLPVADRSLAS